MAWLREKTQAEEGRAGLSGTDRLINLNRVAMFHLSEREAKPSAFVIPYEGARPECISFLSKADAALFMDGLALILETNTRKVYSKRDVIEMGRVINSKESQAR